MEEFNNGAQDEVLLGEKGSCGRDLQAGEKLVSLGTEKWRRPQGWFAHRRRVRAAVYGLHAQSEFCSKKSEIPWPVLITEIGHTRTHMKLPYT